jgi:hypothetical protein
MRRESRAVSDLAQRQRAAATAQYGPALQAAARRVARSAPTSFLLQVGLVIGVESLDDLFHALHGQQAIAVALTNALQVMRLERSLGVWCEPAIQVTLLQREYVGALAVRAGELVSFFNAIYGLGHLAVILAFALWVFLKRRSYFALFRNAFLLTSMLGLVVKEIFPLAPPRLASGLSYLGSPYRFTDTVFGSGSGAQLDFNFYAAMPSLHVAWALLVTVGVVWLARSWLMRLLILPNPCLILTVVIVTGNHYLLDAAGALVVVSLALLLAWLGDHHRTARARRPLVE